jgi:hypothetical protein
MNTLTAPIPAVASAPAASTVVQGRVDYKPNHPRRAEPSKITESQARQLVVNGLGEALRHISQLEEPDRTKQLQLLVNGASATGFVTTATGVRVASVEGLRSLIYSLHRLTTAKTYDHGNRLLFFFAVPRGWSAYAGDVKLDPLVRYYERKDAALAEKRRNWELIRDAVAAGQAKELPPEVPPVVYTKVPGTGSEWGPWVTLLRNGTKPDFIEMPVVTAEGVQRELKPVLVNENAPLHQARTITFVVDAKSGRLLAWQAGRYVADMTPAQRMERVILASGEVDDGDQDTH